MSIKMRQRVERMIARRVILDALRAGYTISVHDGGEVTLQNSTNLREILAVMFTTDEDYLLLRKADSTTKYLSPADNDGWVRFVYGNDGWDVVNDYTTNLDPIMAGADKLADKFQ